MAIPYSNPFNPKAFEDEAKYQIDIEELDATIADVTRHAQNPHLRDYYSTQLVTLNDQRRALSLLLSQLQNSPGYANEVRRREDIARREARRALQQRSADRHAAQIAEVEKYDKTIRSWEWGLIEGEFDDAQRRDIGREHAEKLAERSLEQEALNKPDLLAKSAIKHGVSVDQVSAALRESLSQPLETKSVDKRSGRRFVVVTDSAGTYIEGDLKASLGAEGNGGSE